MDKENKADTQPKKEDPKAQESKDEPKKEPAKAAIPVSPEVLDLAEKVAGDPNSRLFVHLAEEYLKIEMVDEALSVLEDGLKAHPNFLSAKVMLGRAKFEKGEVGEAKSIFEEVASAHPDNLLVQRKLAVIYKDEGKLEAAKKACRAVLALNPKDKEMLEVVTSVEEMEKGRGGTVELGASTGEVPEMQLEQTSHAEKEAAPVSPNEGLEAGKPSAPESLPGLDKSAISTEPMLESTMVVKPDSSGVEPSAGSPPAAEPPAPQKEAPVSPETASPQVMGSSLHDMDGPQGNVEVPQEPLLETNMASEGGGAQTPGKVPDVAAPKPASPSPLQSSPAGGAPLEEMDSEALADLYINQGHVEKGVAIFRKLLSENPGNQALHKKLEEAVQKIRGKSAPDPSPPPAPSGEEKGGAPPSPPAESSQSGGESSKNADKIKRLQGWLDSIKKGQKE